MKYEIDNDTADGITRCVLGETIKFLKKTIKTNKQEIELRGSKAPVTWLQDLEHDEKYLEACKVVYNFFGGNLK